MQIEPNFLSYFGAFDYNSWMLLYHYPKFFSDPVQVPKRKVLDAFTSFFELPMEKRPGVAHFLRTIEVEQRKLDLANRDIASSAFIFYWAYVVLVSTSIHKMSVALTQSIESTAIPGNCASGS